MQSSESGRTGDHNVWAKMGIGMPEDSISEAIKPTWIIVEGSDKEDCARACMSCSTMTLYSSRPSLFASTKTAMESEPAPDGLGLSHLHHGLSSYLFNHTPSLQLIARNRPA